MNMYAEGVFTADAFAVGVLVSACYRRNRCENDVEMLYITLGIERNTFEIKGK